MTAMTSADVRAKDLRAGDLLAYRATTARSSLDGPIAEIIGTVRKVTSTTIGADPSPWVMVEADHPTSPVWVKAYKPHDLVTLWA